CMQGLEFLWTF
nr:immunoglobulin light chain junction region [Macaca mulatta]